MRRTSSTRSLPRPLQELSIADLAQRTARVAGRWSSEVLCDAGGSHAVAELFQPPKTLLSRIAALEAVAEELVGWKETFLQR